MNLYRRTVAGFLETHTLETAFNDMDGRTVIYWEDEEDKEFLEGMRLMHGKDYILKRSCNYISYDMWQWFTYNPKVHY